MGFGFAFGSRLKEALVYCICTSTWGGREMVEM